MRITTQKIYNTLEEYELVKNYKHVTVPTLSKDQEEQAIALHRDLLVFDACALVDADWLKSTNGGYFKSALEAGITVINNTTFSTGTNFRNAITEISKLFEVLQHYREVCYTRQYCG